MNEPQILKKGGICLQETDILETEKAEPDMNAEAEPAEKLYSQAELDAMLRNEREQLEKKLAEAEKLAAMSESARSDYKREMLTRELAEREAAVAKRELIMDAADRLAAAGLPKQLSLCLNYDSKDECQASLEAVSRVFIDAVTAAVNERVRGRSPKFMPAQGNDPFLDGLKG